MGAVQGAAPPTLRFSSAHRHGCLLVTYPSLLVWPLDRQGTSLLWCRLWGQVPRRELVFQPGGSRHEWFLGSLLTLGGKVSSPCHLQFTWTNKVITHLTKGVTVVCSSMSAELVLAVPHVGPRDGFCHGTSPPLHPRQEKKKAAPQTHPNLHLACDHQDHTAWWIDSLTLCPGS